MHYSDLFGAGVLKTLNPEGCVAFGGALDRRIKNLKVEAKKLNSVLNKFESAEAFLRCDAFAKLPLLNRKKTTRSGGMHDDDDTAPLSVTKIVANFDLPLCVLSLVVLVVNGAAGVHGAMATSEVGAVVERGPLPPLKRPTPLPPPPLKRPTPTSPAPPLKRSTPTPPPRHP
jgi:hypothetical protein